MYVQFVKTESTRTGWPSRVESKWTYPQAIDEIRKLSSRMIYVSSQEHRQVDCENIQQINRIFDWDVRILDESELATHKLQFSDAESDDLMLQLELVANSVARGTSIAERVVPEVLSDGSRTKEVLVRLMIDVTR